MRQQKGYMAMERRDVAPIIMGSSSLKSVLARWLLIGPCMVLVSLSVCASPAQSAPSVTASSDSDEFIGLRETYVDCLEGGGTTTAAILTCAHDEFVFQDKRLNDVYKRLMETLGMSDKQKLREEERKWLAFKESRCSLNNDAGTIDQISASDCAVRETARRAKDLQRRTE